MPLEGRAACDPRALARLARDKDLRSSEINDLLVERHSPLAHMLFPTPLDFRRAFDDAMRELEFPDEAPPPKATVVFEAPASSPLRPGPHHDLPVLFREMAAIGTQLLGGPVAFDAPLEWTRRILKGLVRSTAYFAGARAGRIRWSTGCSIHQTSPRRQCGSCCGTSISHVHLQQRHTPEFRRLERMWPEYQACDRELDALNEKFGVNIGRDSANHVFPGQAADVDYAQTNDGGATGVRWNADGALRSTHRAEPSVARFHGEGPP